MQKEGRRVHSTRQTRGLGQKRSLFREDSRMLYRRWVYAAMMLRTPFLTDDAFSVVVPMDAPMVLKMAAEDLHHNFVSSSTSFLRQFLFFF